MERGSKGGEAAFRVERETWGGGSGREEGGGERLGGRGTAEMRVGDGQVEEEVVEVEMQIHARHQEEMEVHAEDPENEGAMQSGGQCQGGRSRCPYVDACCDRARGDSLLSPRISSTKP
jgi:hypothetical protein